jgi:hypothetical protein
MKGFFADWRSKSGEFQADGYKLLGRCGNQQNKKLAVFGAFLMSRP